MKTKRLAINLILFLGLFFAFYILAETLVLKEWNTVSGSLAVITAIVGSWSAQRIIWKQEEELQPNLNISLDLKGRKGITQFLIENVGGSSAYDVQIIWEKPLIGRGNKEIHFKSGIEGVDFKRITKGQKFTCFVGVTHRLFDESKTLEAPLDYYGYIHYKKKPKGRLKTKEDFFVSLEPYRNSLDIEDDYQNFFYEGAKIHKDLVEINKTLKNE